MPPITKAICPGAGCRNIVASGTRCERHAKQKWQEQKKEKTTVRGYGGRWQATSEGYRRSHPLCVPCLLVGRVTGTQCVDHIIPRHSCESLFWEHDNWCSMCSACHGRKTQKEPQSQWNPDAQRIVVCGLPGTGKTTWAKATGYPTWDADEHQQLTTVEAIQEERTRWIRQHRSGPCVVIVASPATASNLAEMIGGTVKHMTEVYVSRTALT